MEPSSEPTPWTPRRDPLGESNGWHSPESTVAFEAPRTIETAPQGSRLAPPPAPPAPPGTAGASPLWDGSDDGTRATLDSVSALLAPSYQAACALAAYLDIYRQPTDAVNAWEDLRVQDLRAEVRHHVTLLQLLLGHDTRSWGRTEFGRWRLELLRLAKRGASRSELDRHFGANLFRLEEREQPAEARREPANRYVYQCRYLSARLGMIPPGEALQRFVDDLLQEIDDPANYADVPTFRSKVMLKLLAFLYAADLATKPVGTPAAPETTPKPPRWPNQDEAEAACRHLLGEEERGA